MAFRNPVALYESGAFRGRSKLAKDETDSLLGLLGLLFLAEQLSFKFLHGE
jgi:hypothetical protein